MNADSLQRLLSLAEQQYFAEQALTLLDTCVDQGHLGPLARLVERLVWEGPRHLPVLRQALQEAQRRRQQVEADLTLIWQEIQRHWAADGLPPLPVASLTELLAWDAAERQRWVRQHLAPPQQHQGERLLHNACTLGQAAVQAWQLLGEIEAFLQDWLWGLACQAFRAATIPTGPVL